MEGRLPGARGDWSPTGGWKPPLFQPTADSDSEMHPIVPAELGEQIGSCAASAAALHGR